MEPEMQYAVAKLYSKVPPSPNSLREGLVLGISSFCSRIDKFQFTAHTRSSCISAGASPYLFSSFTASVLSLSISRELFTKTMFAAAIITLLRVVLSFDSVTPTLSTCSLRPLI